MTAVAVGDDRSLRVTIDTTAVREVFERVPRAAYFWTRDYLFRIAVAHRQKWLATKRPGFGRGGGGQGEPVRVARVGEGNVPPRPNELTYDVQPKERRAPNTAAAGDMIDRLQFQAYTGNLVMPVHEFGDDIRSSRFMAIPVKTRPSTPKAWRAKYPEKTLVARPSKRDGKVLLFELIRTAARGRPRKDGTRRPPKERLRLRFLLTKAIEMDPTLRLYDSWDDLEQERDSLWGGAATKMLRDLERGVDS